MKNDPRNFSTFSILCLFWRDSVGNWWNANEEIDLILLGEIDAISLFLQLLIKMLTSPLQMLGHQPIILTREAEM
jgi:hypothetical protein